MNIAPAVFGGKNFLTWCEECREHGMPQTKGFYDAFCNFKTKDADKICEDSNECEGMCVVAGSYDTEGKCSKYMDFEQFECGNIIKDGEVIRQCAN